MTLKQWRDKYDKSQEWVGHKLGVTQQAVNSWEQDGLNSMSRILEIEKMTKGVVRAKDWA